MRENGFTDEDRLFTEADLDPVEFFNALVSSAVRVPDPEADAAALEAVRRLQKATEFLPRPDGFP